MRDIQRIHNRTQGKLIGGELFLYSPEHAAGAEKGDKKEGEIGPDSTLSGPDRVDSTYLPHPKTTPCHP